MRMRAYGSGPDPVSLGRVVSGEIVQKVDHEKIALHGKPCCNSGIIK